MATGDQQDMVTRLKAAIPQFWFQGSTPVYDAILNGLGYALAFVYSLFAYAKLQTRIATATDGFLDLISFDYFGSALPRNPSESDTTFRARIFFNLLAPRATRAGMIRMLTGLTGFIPQIFEPWRPLDTGAWNTNIWGYGVAGGYGSLAVPAQCFIIVNRPLDQGIANIAGYNFPQGAYNTGSQIEYANPSLIAGAVTDEDIYAAIAANKPEGTIAWTQLQN